MVRNSQFDLFISFLNACFLNACEMKKLHHQVNQYD